MAVALENLKILKEHLPRGGNYITMFCLDSRVVLFLISSLFSASYMAPSLEGKPHWVCEEVLKHFNNV